SNWVPGNAGGESESINGEWLQSRGRRSDVVIVTKVGGRANGKLGGLAPAHIERTVEESLRRLRTDYIDVYLSHYPDPSVPYEETLAAYDRLVKAGKVRAAGGSNHDAGQLEASLGAAKTAGTVRYEVLQPEYNLYDRDRF